MKKAKYYIIAALAVLAISGVVTYKRTVKRCQTIWWYTHCEPVK